MKYISTSSFPLNQHLSPKRGSAASGPNCGSLGQSALSTVTNCLWHHLLAIHCIPKTSLKVNQNALICKSRNILKTSIQGLS